MDDKIYDILMKLNREQLVAVMWNALDQMNQYNGRSKTYCIAVALGLEPEEDENGEYTITIPSLAEIKRNCTSSFL